MRVQLNGKRMVFQCENVSFTLRLTFMCASETYISAILRSDPEIRGVFIVRGMAYNVHTHSRDGSDQEVLKNSSM